ncbi:MAG: L,D-transpeptidase [Dehalococcoidia bacterium]|jgi:lipoprotein-anchoring transpeptidase ErfK/SrfK
MSIRKPARSYRFGFVLVGLLLAAALVGIGLVAGCDRLPLHSSATSTPLPVPTDGPPPADTLVPTAAPVPGTQLVAGTSIVVGGPVRLRGDPSTVNPPTGTVYDGQTLKIAALVKGENWLIGSQTWVSSIPEWTTDWYRLDDGSYIYGAFVFTLLPGETSPTINPGGAEKWIDVNLTNQTVTAMIGNNAIHMALATSGSADFPTPQGTHHIEPDGRVASVDMTATQAGYSPAQATYDVQRVLFTQYFDRMGNAIHLNYWRPEEVYGNTPTSHGCVGLQLHDAQYFWLFGAPNMRVEIHN